MHISNLKKPIHKLRPARMLVIGFLCIILVGALLLSLPFSNTAGVFLNPIDAIFTATSAVCVTGLVVFDTGVEFTLLGQIIIILLIQIGGLGFMTGAVIVFFLIRKRISLKNRIVMQEAMNKDTLQGLVKLMTQVIIMTFIVEFVGFLLLAVRFVPQFGIEGWWVSLFHAISSFCNAGFDLMGGFTSLTAYATDAYICLVISALIIFGGLGYTVVLEVVGNAKKGIKFKRLSLHAKIVLSFTAILLASGTLFFLIAEWNNPYTMKDMNFFQKLIASFFQSVTTRTAGFNTIDQAKMTHAACFFSMMLMIVGASPASTGGGLKTTTVYIMYLSIVRVIKGREDVECFGRRLSNQLVRRTISIVCLYVIGLSAAITLILLFEVNSPFTLEAIMYEVISAAGTVGISMGITPSLSTASHIVLILVMFMGRLGPLSLAFAFAGNDNKTTGIRFTEEKIMVG